MATINFFCPFPPQRGTGTAPSHLELSELSIVVPVKNNQRGIDRLLESCLQIFSPEHCPREILVVDNGSQPPLELPAQLPWPLPVHILVCPRSGAAAARNMGARKASGNWLLLMDSDCIPTATLIGGYQEAMDGSIGYAGAAQVASSDVYSAYYEAQHILSPPALVHEGSARPAFMVTANALIWRAALAQVGGLDERFKSAGCEDIDLGLRLWSVGPLAYAPKARVQHAFEADLGSFVRRFIRYGHGSRLMSALYHEDLSPRLVVPQPASPANRALALVQLLALWWGYLTIKPEENWSQPRLMTSWQDERPSTV
ncbi:glycosyltransferase family 2 protein [Ktedonosporobacter rubrisoli]|nr:glycosyltransferase [Ktedonosporobacter rubrisoli]